ncbi:MAG: PhoX family phosphatase [Alphaproteobacteria bacterium]|nr:PhoX family phosphatase [Alphaproteobacteria bacterium]
MSEDPIRNPLRERPFSEILDARYSRRALLGGMGKLGILAAAASIAKPTSVFAQESLSSASSLTFQEIAKNTSATHSIASGYTADLLIRWGDRLTADAPEFNPLTQSGAAQQQQFGYNNDFLAYHAFPLGSQSSTRGILCANNEYTSSYLMFPDLPYDDTIAMRTTKEQVDVEMAAQGHSIFEVQKTGNKWKPVIGSPYNRRLTPFATDFAVSGPAAGHVRMRTTEDPDGINIRGTFGNCAGGVTPWHTTLICEENFDGYFMGEATDEAETENYKRYGINDRHWYGWGRFYDRYDVAKEPHEPNRFGWVVEYDPFDPKRKPVKRTALGRCKHETATTTLAPDGRVVVYTGDDERFEYIYRFVSTHAYDANNREANFTLLDDGVLSVAKFYEDGSMEWLPLVLGQNGLTAENGFHSQGDVLIETRRAGDIVGATPMDRPEGIAVHPSRGEVYVSLTNNSRRTSANAANGRVNNIHGHIITLSPPNADHAAVKFSWQTFLQAGNPADSSDNALYPGEVSSHGWLSCPDNLTMAPNGNLWICTDGQPKTLQLNDGLYASDVSGRGNSAPKLFLTGPLGCEITGPAFTPDGQTLFLAVQHPGDGDGASFDEPTSRWPDFNPALPPRPSILTISKKDGGIIGS